MTSDVVNPILQWLNTHPNLAGLATFLISASESIAIIGTIIPGSVTMTAIGTLAGSGVIPLWSTIIWAILGAIIGDNFSFWIGHYFKNRLPYIWPFRSYPQLLGNGEKFIQQHGMKSVIIGRFIGPVRALVPIVAGMLGMKPLRYISVSIIASIIWAPIYMLPGILIGKATLELPPDVAVHAIMTCLFVGFFALFCLWIIYRLFRLIHVQINHLLNMIWVRLSRSRFFHIFTTVLKHHNPNHTHGQLTLAFYLILACVAYLNLSTFVLMSNAADVTINKIIYYLFRSLKTASADKAMLILTLIGDKKVLLPVVAIFFAYLAWIKRWRVAFHVAALFLLAIASIIFFKDSVHSPRPWGIANNAETFSFPSGHTTISMTFYVGLALLIATQVKEKYRYLIYSLFTCLVVVISISRLYLGAHWLTDVAGGLLLSAILLMLVSLSYNRKRENALSVKNMLLVVIISLMCSFGFQYIFHFDQLKANYSKVDWPVTSTSLDKWWGQKGDEPPLYRIGRLGLAAEAFNVEWVGNINEIKTILLNQGWEMPETNDWVTVLHRISDVSSAEHLPVVAPLYLDKKPVLVLTKRINGDKNLIVLRLWNSNILLKDTHESLWVGSIIAVPRTYSWLIHYKNTNPITVTANLLFTKTPTEFDVKQENINVYLKRKNRWQTQPLILIKPQHIS